MEEVPYLSVFAYSYLTQMNIFEDFNFIITVILYTVPDASPSSDLQIIEPFINGRIQHCPNRASSMLVRSIVDPVRVPDDLVRTAVDASPMPVRDRPTIHGQPRPPARSIVDPVRVPDDPVRTDVDASPMPVRDRPTIHGQPRPPARSIVDPVRALDDPVRSPDDPVRSPDDPVRLPNETVRAPDKPVRPPDGPVRRFQARTSIGPFSSTITKCFSTKGPYLSFLASQKSAHKGPSRIQAPTSLPHHLGSFSTSDSFHIWCSLLQLIFATFTYHIWRISSRWTSPNSQPS